MKYLNVWRIIFAFITSVCLGILYDPYGLTLSTGAFFALLAVMPYREQPK